MNFFEQIEYGKKHCLKDAPAPCSNACPLGMDVRDFIKKLEGGMISAAYKAFRLHAVLPGTVCHICGQPCASACVREQVDQAIDLKSLERFCWQQMRGQPKKNYYIREKKERILICGGGPRELTAAVKLARRGYPVDMAVKGEQLGGALWEMGEERLPAEVLEEDIRDIYEEKLIHVTSHVKAVPRERWNEYAAVLLSEEYEEDDELLWEEKCFRPGSFGSPLEEIRQGTRLSYQIEEFVKIHKVFMTKEEPEQLDPYVPDISGLDPRKPAIPADAGRWTKEEAISEAARCIQCQCSLCSDVCPMMQYYHEDYKQLSSAVLDTVEAQEIDRKRGLYPLMSCLQCGACEQVCPANIDTRKMILSSRRMLHKKKTLPQAHYHFWLQDMEHANHRGACFIPAEKSCRYLYFPGCQMGASFPDYVTRSYAWLRSLHPQETALWLRCCCAPAQWSGNEALCERETEEIRIKWEELGRPVFVLSCPTCMEQFRERLPEIETGSLWSMLAGNLRPEEKKNRRVAIFDSCAARGNETLQADIRKIVSLAGFEEMEPEGNPDFARCCGYGGLVYSTNPQLVEQVIEENSRQSEAPFVTYCTNCMDSFRMKGGKASFLFDLIFEGEPQKEVPDLTRRRENRIKLKQQLRREYLKEERREEPMPYQELQLRMDTRVKESINRQLLLEADLKQIIGEAEEHKNWLYDADTGERIVHKMSGFITIWIRYRALEGSAYEIYACYFHRVRLKGEENAGK